MNLDLINPKISQAKTLNKEFYLSNYYFETAKSKIFQKTWHYIADKSEFNVTCNTLPNIILEEYLDEPIILTKDKDNQIHCLSNVCNHRGNLLCTEPCLQSNIRCKYHGRLFSLNGTFISMPEFKNVENFIPENNHLPKLPLFNIGNLLFTSLSPDIEANIYFQDMLNRLSWYPFKNLIYKPALTKNFNVQANWALYCENFLEGFHIPFVHPVLNSFIDFSNYTTEIFEYSSVQLGISKDKKNCFELPNTSVDYGKNIGAYYFWVFPNMMFNFYPWGLSVNIIEPKTTNTTKVRFLQFVLDESKIGLGAGTGLDQVEFEDEEIVQNVQKGIRSMFYNNGRYSPEREQGTHHFHSLIAKKLS